MNKKNTLCTAIGVVLGSTAMTAGAALTSSATLSFTLGTPVVVSCTYGTAPPCSMASLNITDVAGSWFALDTNGSGGADPNEKTGIESDNGIHIGSVQAASGTHSGPITGGENGNIDKPWTFFGGTGLHQTTSPVVPLSVTSNGATLDMSGWNVAWNGIASIPLTQLSAVMSCTAGSSCSDTSSYTLDAVFHVPGFGFTSVTYSLHLEGHVSSVPVPAAAWLFGSGLLGLAGTARRRKYS